MYKQLVFSLFFLSCLLPAQTPSKPEERPDQLDLRRSSIPGLEPSRIWGQPFEPMTKAEKFHHQISTAFGPWSLGTVLASAALDQWQNDPVEWRQGWDAFGQRAASRMGVRMVRRGIRYGISALRHEDPRFFRAAEAGFRKRMQNQLKQTLITRTDSGGVTFAAGRIVSAFGAAHISQAWTPDSRDGVGANFQRGGLVLGTDLATRVLREFWPDIRRRIFHRP